MNQPPKHTPACTALGGCIGAAWCDYCGRPMPVSHAARRRLAALIDVLRQSLSDRPAA